MIKERTPLALKLATRIKGADRIAIRAFANYTTTLVGSSKGYSVIVRNIAGEELSSFNLPEQETAHGDVFVLRSKAFARPSHRNPWQGTTYNHIWKYIGVDACSIELLLNDQVVDSKLITQ